MTSAEPDSHPSPTSFSDELTDDADMRRAVDLARPLLRSLKYERLCDRSIVHRASNHEVFLTEAKRTSTDTYLVGVQWPRRHHLSRWDRPEQLAPGLVVEAVRQIGIMLPHAFVQAPLDAVFLAHTLGFGWTAAGPLDFHGSAIEAAGVATLRSQGKGQSRTFRLAVSLLTTDGVKFAFGSGSMTTISPRVYRRLRGHAALASSAHLANTELAALDARDVGRSRPDQVVLHSPTVTTGNDLTQRGLSATEMRIDPLNPFYFDHPYDHVPATLILEAIQQAAIAQRGGKASTGVQATFARYTELLPPPQIRIDHVDATLSRVSVHQAGGITASGSVTFT